MFVRQQNVLLPILLLVFAATSASFAETRVSLNQDRRFVLHADNLNTTLLFFSGEGLIPAESAAPFQTLLVNNQWTVEYSTPNSITLDGDLTLTSGLSENGVLRDVSTGLNGELPFDMSTCIADCPQPSLDVTLSSNHRFVLQGSNHKLNGIDFISPLGTLDTADSVLPFSTFAENTNQRVGFRADSPVTIDGSVTLNAGWDVNKSIADIRYEYTEASGEKTGQIYIPIEEYPSSTSRHLNTFVNDENKIVLRGLGQQLNSLAFSSRSGSLTPSATAEPFDQLVSNTSEEISFGGGGSVSLVGDVILGAGWDPGGDKDIRVQYDGAADTADSSFFLSRGDYPNPAGRPETWMSLDEDFKFIVHGNGQWAGVDLISADGGLVPAASPSPFQLALSNNSKQATYANLGTTVDIQGAQKLDVGWNPFSGATELKVQYGDGPTPVPIEVLASDLAVCPGCRTPEVSFAPGGGFQISGFETELSAITFTSSSGALLSAASIDGLSLSTNSPNLIELTSDGGLDAFDLTNLPVAWSIVDSQDVHVSFTTLSGATIGPFAVPPSTYEQAFVPEPSAISLLAMGGGIALLYRRRRRSIVGV